MSKVAVKIKLSEIFRSIQGEGAYVGYPMLFIRVSGCNRECDWCDTKYHKKRVTVDIMDVIEDIRLYSGRYICFTGGEPLLYREQLKHIIDYCRGLGWEKEFHIETNGDLLNEGDLSYFDYISASPKTKEVAERLWDAKRSKKRNNLFGKMDIKVVTDLKKVNMGLLKYATMLMPLTTNTYEDVQIKKSVWGYCSEKSIRYSPRLHLDVWGGVKGV